MLCLKVKAPHGTAEGAEGTERGEAPMAQIKKGGGQECPPTVNSCSGKAGYLGVLSDLGERPFLDAGCLRSEISDSIGANLGIALG